MTNRRKFLRAVPAVGASMVVAPRVGELIDPVLRQEVQLPPTVYRRKDYRILVPQDSTAIPCDACGEVHAVSGRAVYTIGCQPAALPVGFTKWYDNETGVQAIEIPDDVIAHPIELDGPIARSACPGARAPHYHPDIIWE